MDSSIQQIQPSSTLKRVAQGALSALVITGVALAALGIVALLAHYYHLPSPFSQLDKPLYEWSFALIAGGVSWIGIGGAGLFAIHHFTKRKQQENLAKVPDLLHRSSSRKSSAKVEQESEEEFPNKSNLTQTEKEAILAFKQIENPDQEKYYYDKRTKKICSDEDSKPPKEHRFVFVRLKDGDYLFKEKKKIGRGVSKKAFVEHTISGKEYVRTLEPDPYFDYEKYIHQELSEDTTLTHIVKLYDIIDVKKGNKIKRHFVLEYCSNGTFVTKINKLSEKEQIQIYADIFYGLDELHQHGYLHFDLNDGNIFITKDKRGKLGDFGNSRKMEDLKKLKKQVKDRKWTANRQFLAPEIIQTLWTSTQAKNISGKADVWGLGFSLAETLYDKQQLPALNTVFKAQEKYSVLYNGRTQFVPDKLDEVQVVDYCLYLHKNYPKAPQKKESLDHLIWEMLHPNPEGRPTAKEAAERLEHFLV